MASVSTFLAPLSYKSFKQRALAASLACHRRKFSDANAESTLDQNRAIFCDRCIHIATNVTADLQNILPAVVIRAPRGSFRSSTALVAMVVPCMSV